MGILSWLFDEKQVEKPKELPTYNEETFIIKDMTTAEPSKGYVCFYFMSDKGKVYIGGRYIKENIFVFKNIKIGDRVRSTTPYGKYEDYWSIFKIIRSVSDNK